MEQSPLVLQARPHSFQPKIVELYQSLFETHPDGAEEADKPEGFWLEFFLLKPDKAKLHRIVADLGPDDLLQLHCQTRSFFSRAVNHISNASAPSDENALDTLTAFLGAALTKRYTNPSSDVISVLTGLNQVDAIFTDFVAGLDWTIKNGRDLPVRLKAIEAALSLTSGAYQTGLLSYLTHRDLFPALMKFVSDSDNSSGAFEAFLLLGLLANYNKFEFQNPYRLRLDDFVNEGTIQHIVRAVRDTCVSTRDRYIEIQDDLPEGWTFTNTMSYIGLGVLTPGSKPIVVAPSPEAAKALFAALPPPECAILLATYDFANANKLFCFNLVCLPAESKNDDAAFSAFLSLTSYLVNHAHRSLRTSLYAYINLLIIRILVEDQVLCKRICTDETKLAVRLCRQRQPYLPLVKGERRGANVVLDIMIDSINKNLRRRLDVDFYKYVFFYTILKEVNQILTDPQTSSLTLSIILRLISFLSRSRTRLSEHPSTPRSRFPSSPPLDRVKR
ncbi:MAG: hypothetical protein M1825_001178 [Sarcosagium campestre]|nr:MAG: hypothetical protein M1825_001178 [Sarcosagium campestre]